MDYGFIFQNYKVILAVIATVISVYAFLPYIKDVVTNKVQPHIYTWLIWSLVQAIAVAGMISGGASWGALSISMSTILFISVFLILVYKRDFSYITKLDSILLFGVLIAIILWVVTNDPLMSVVLVTGIDAVGYVPTIRKLIFNKTNEQLLFWLLMSVTGIMSMSALSTYSLLTLIYPITLFVCNMTIVIILLLRHSYNVNK